jgi:HD-GYP domain-containing protein (c-di-GMP phosphodiesterase class II)
MYITDENNAWIPQQNMRKRGLIKSVQTIERIRQLGVTELFIDTARGADVPDNPRQAAMHQVQEEQFESLRVQSGNLPQKKLSMAAEREHAAKVHSEAKTLIGGLLDGIKQGQSIDTRAVTDLADELIVSLDNNLDALSCLSRIRSKDAYLLEHSVNVGILLGIFARSRQLDRTIVKELVTGGLLHDIGKIMVPSAILNKPGKLEAEEWEEMKRHVTYGEQVLDVTEGLSDLTRSICALHHERLDGSGYPRGLPEAQIPVYGRMAAIVDVYDAITADRVYHQGMSPHEALKKLIEWSVFHLDKQLVYDFIRCITIYPVGTLVALDNGHAGVVIEANPGVALEPVVRIFYTVRHRHYLDPYVIDLAKKPSRHSIVDTLEPGDLGINEMDFI